MRADRVGLVGHWDCVTFDEVAGMRFKDTNAVQIMKDYMASGSYARGRDQINADASMVFEGNINDTVQNVLKTTHLFDPFPPEFNNDSAFFDRIHYYLPGWEIPKMRSSLLTGHYGLITDCLSEFCKEMRRKDFTHHIDRYFRFNSDFNKRDEIAVRKSFSGLAKLLFPDEAMDKDDVRWLLDYAIEGRHRVKEQLKIMAGVEFIDVNLGYMDADNAHRARPAHPVCVQSHRPQGRSPLTGFPRHRISAFDRRLCQPAASGKSRLAPDHSSLNNFLRKDPIMKNFNASVSRRSLLTSFAAGLGIVALGGLTACGGSSAPAGSAAADSSVLTVAASPAPHAEILTDFAAPLLAEQGIELKVKEYTDYIQPNKDTSAGSVDANYFQHITYLEDYNEKNGTDLVSAGLIHYEPFAVYAGTSDDLDNISDGATVAIPNDPTNEGRALLLLQDLGLITLSDPENLESTPKDIFF